MAVPVCVWGRSGTILVLEQYLTCFRCSNSARDIYGVAFLLSSRSGDVAVQAA